MYNIIFETEPSNRQNIFNEVNPIIMMMIHDFNLDIIEMHMFYQNETPEMNLEIDRMLADGDTIHKHQIENFNVSSFGDAVFEVMRTKLNESLISSEIFDPLIISGTYYSTDKIKSALNSVFRKNSKILKDYNLSWEAYTMLEFGFSSDEHLDRVILAGLETVKPEDFEDTIDGRAYKKALITQPERKK